ncbi:hypothetical protein [Streptomyces meridianus]|uniref:Uncharacterized protein n=1 Tax=Streptomyces meridianus TaxID=2938945 RepID=A0ABT0XB49_9ACTN|nr:hypothetical protein [Streptomyces meridianus]MCM2579751.1 hypothetical protein [Streptomyces meridianus]
MRNPPPERVASALEPARAQLLRAARADAEAALALADREADDLLRRGDEEAETILAEARRAGEAEGADAARASLARARRTARERGLHERGAAYDELRARTVRRLRELMAGTGNGNPAGITMARRARRLLGPDAEVAEPPGGGLIARAEGRCVDYSPEALADRALARFGAEAETLWAP